jgi:hypothetical protein
MTFERGIFAESLHVANNRMAFILAAVIGQFAVQLAQETTLSNVSLTFASAIVWSMLALTAHMETLKTGESDGQNRDIYRIFSFAVRSVCLVVLAALPCLWLLGMTIETSDPETAIGAFMVAVVPAFAASSVLVFALLGTALPAFVANADESAVKALGRGLRQFAWLASRLIAPALLAILASILLVAPVVVFGDAGYLLSGGFVPSLTMTPFALTANVLLAWAVVLTSVILTRGYLRDSADAPADNLGETV